MLERKKKPKDDTAGYTSEQLDQAVDAVAAKLKPVIRDVLLDNGIKK